MLKNLSFVNHHVIALQEINSNIKNLKFFASNSLPNKKSYFSVSNENTHASLAIYFNKEFEVLQANELIPGRLCKLLFRYNDLIFYFYNVYNFTSAYSQESIDLIQMLSHDLHVNALYPTYIVGDFNVNMNQTNRLAMYLGNLINDHELIDVGDYFNELNPTWRGNGHRNRSISRIDFIFTKNLSHTDDFFETISVPQSDHKILSLDQSKQSMDSLVHPFSKIKEHLLQNPDFRETFLSKLILTLKKYFCFNQLENAELQTQFLNIQHIDEKNLSFLDQPGYYDSDLIITMFHEVFLIIAECTHSTHKKIKSRKNKLFNKFRNACKKLDQNLSNSDSAYIEYDEVRTEYKNQCNEQFKLCQDFLRIKKFQNSNQKSKNIFNFLSRGEGRDIKRIRNPINGIVTNDPNEIVEIFTNNYRSKTHDPENQSEHPSFTFPDVLNDLLQEYNASLNDIFPIKQVDDSTFTINEIKDVLKKMKNKVATGRSKISKHTLIFILKFIPNLFTSYINLLTCKDDLSSDKRTSWILTRDVIFIKKKSNDTLDVNSYRPISLLETLYKLISKLTISRLEDSIFSFLSPSQFGFVRGKHMSTATHLINQIVQKIQNKNINAALLSIDVRAAFDTTRHTTTNAILAYVFPESAIAQIISKLSHNPIAQVNIGGFLGSDVYLSQGCGQGDNSSSTKFLLVHHLFNFFLERFLTKHNIAICKDILHESLPPNPQENISFADDTLLLVNQNLTYVVSQQLLSLYDKLKILTGLEINPRKSNFVVIGPNPLPSFCNALTLLGTKKTAIEHLGVYLSNDPNNAKELTYNKVLSSMSKHSKYFSNMTGNIDIFTKIYLIKALIISKAQHCFRVYSPSTDTINEIWKIFTRSLWTSSFQDKQVKRTKVAKTRLLLPLECGGLEIMHVQTTATLSMLSSFTSILLHANLDKNSIFAASLHGNPTEFNNAISFFNPYFFRKFWVKPLKSLFNGEHLIEHSKSLIDKLEFDKFYGLFMPVTHHSLLNKRVTLLGILKPSLFQSDGALHRFRNVLSLLDIYTLCRKKYIRKNSYNPDIDDIPDENQKTALKSFAKSIQNHVNFKLNKFALRNKSLTFFELVAKFSPKFLNRALKKSAKKINMQNFPPPPSWNTRRNEQLATPSLEIFRKSYALTRHSQIPPSMRSFHFDYLSRVLPSLTKLVQFNNNEIYSAVCPRQECSETLASSEHITYECVFVQSILKFVNYAYSHKEILLFKRISGDEFFLFPHFSNKIENFLEKSVFAIQIKIMAFRIVKETRFGNWTHQHFYVKLLSIIKTSIDVCDLYKISNIQLKRLLDYAEENALALIETSMQEHTPA